MFRAFLFHEFLKRPDQFVQFLVMTFRDILFDTSPDVIRKQYFGKTVQRAAGCGHLGNDVDTVSVLIEHPLNAADLSGDPGKTVGQVFV